MKRLAETPLLLIYPPPTPLLLITHLLFRRTHSLSLSLALSLWMCVCWCAQESEKKRQFLLFFGAASATWFLALPLAYYSSQVRV